MLLGNIMFKKKNLQISVCIPVYNSEKYLLRCLESVKNQDFSGTEIILVNDCSNGTDENGNDFFQIVKKFRKSCKIPVKIVTHSQNKGLLEARRSAVFEASSKYITFLDSDDFFPEGSLKNLFDAAEESGAEIVQGKVEIIPENVFSDKEKERLQKIDKIRNKICFSPLKDEEIIFSFMSVKKNGIENHSGFVTGKLFTREICAKAFSYLPIIFCTMGEDFVLYTMFTYFAKKYKGIPCVVYSYSCDTGVTSKKTIDTLEKWEKVCSAASAFTVLFNLIKNEPEIKMPFECVESIKVQCRRILRNNISQMHTSVPEKLIPEARNMLCDYWGSDFVAEIEKDYYSCASVTENSSDAE